MYVMSNLSTIQIDRREQIGLSMKMKGRPHTLQNVSFEMEVVGPR